MIEEPTDRESYRNALDQVAQFAIENGVDQSVVCNEAEKFADRTRLTKLAAEKEDLGENDG